MVESNEPVDQHLKRRWRFFWILFIAVFIAVLLPISREVRRSYRESQLILWIEANNNIPDSFMGFREVQVLPSWVSDVPILDKFAEREHLSSFVVHDCTMNEHHAKLLDSAEHLQFFVLSKVVGLQHLCDSKTLQLLEALCLVECDVPPRFFNDSLTMSDVSFCQMSLDQPTVNSVLQLPNLKSISFWECSLPDSLKTVESVDLDLQSISFRGEGSSETALTFLPIVNSPQMTVTFAECRCDSNLVDYVCAPARFQKIHLFDVDISYSNARKVLLHNQENIIYFLESLIHNVIPPLMSEEEYLSLIHEFPNQFFGPGNLYLR